MRTAGQFARVADDSKALKLVKNAIVKSALRCIAKLTKKYCGDTVTDRILTRKKGQVNRSPKAPGAQERP